MSSMQPAVGIVGALAPQLLWQASASFCFAATSTKAMPHELVTIF